MIQGGDLISLLTGGALESFDTNSIAVSSAETVLDKKLLPKIEKILNKLGKTLTFKTYPNAVEHDVEGTVELGGLVEYQRKAIPPYEVEEKHVNGDTILSGDMLTGIAGKDLEFMPVAGMTVVIDSIDWNIVRIKPVYSGEQIALFVVQLRN